MYVIKCTTYGMYWVYFGEWTTNINAAFKFSNAEDANARLSTYFANSTIKYEVVKI